MVKPHELKSRIESTLKVMERFTTIPEYDIIVQLPLSKNELRGKGKEGYALFVYLLGPEHATDYRFYGMVFTKEGRLIAYQVMNLEELMEWERAIRQTWNASSDKIAALKKVRPSISERLARWLLGLPK